MFNNLGIDRFLFLSDFFFLNEVNSDILYGSLETLYLFFLNEE
jgi:hypothetical protein